MTLLLAHGFALLFLMGVIAHRLYQNPIDKIMATAVMAWANIVITALALSSAHWLGNPLLFVRVSILFALLLFLGLRVFFRVGADVSRQPAATSRIDWLPIAAFVVTITPLAVANLLIARSYLPNNYDSLTYHLPRVMFYLGQGTLAHFDTENSRQIFFPFNLSLLHLAILQHGVAFEKVLTILNIGFWFGAGAAIYRICRLADYSMGASLAAAWLAMTATQVLAQATATTNDLPTGAVLLVAVVFIQRWLQARQFRDAIIVALALGLAFGSKLTPVFFIPAVAVLGAILMYRARASIAGRDCREQIRTWIFPGTLVLILAVPFVFYNVKATGHLMTSEYDFSLNKPFSFGVFWQTAKTYTLQFFFEPLQRFTFDLSMTAALNHLAEKLLFPHWNSVYAFSPLYFFPPDLNEDHVWFGFSGAFVIISALACARRERKQITVISSLAILGLGWLIIYFALNKWSLYIQRYFVLPFLLMTPCVAFYFDKSAAWRVPRSTMRTTLMLLFATSFWFSLSYLLQNTARPLVPILFKSANKPQELEVPRELMAALSRHSDINMSLAGGNERTFPLMRAASAARFTSNFNIDPSKFNLISKWAFTKNAVYHNIAAKESHQILSVPAKHTAGVENLGSIGAGVDEFIYFGLEPHASQSVSSIQNSNVLIVLGYKRAEPERYMNSRMQLLGLNIEDGIEATIFADYPSGSKVLLGAVRDSSEIVLPIKSVATQLVVELREIDSGVLVARSVLPVMVLESKKVATGDDLDALFNLNLIATDSAGDKSVSGLRALEGPYPQWSLPLFRWAAQPTVRIVSPARDDLKQIQVILSIRLQIRENAELELLHNGKRVKLYNLMGRTSWLDDSVNLPAAQGENIIELRDTLADVQPDWESYLANNPDAVLWAKRQGLATLPGAEQHYDRIGRGEGRAVIFKKMSEKQNTPADSLYFVFRTLRVVGLKEEAQ